MDRSDLVDAAHQALVAQEAERQGLRRLAERHERHQFALVDVQRQWMFAGDGHGRTLAMLVERFDLEGEVAPCGSEFQPCGGRGRQHQTRPSNICTSTTVPAGALPWSTGSTMKQFACDIEDRMPEPCSPVGFTCQP